MKQPGRLPIIAIVLAAITLWLYLPALQGDFVNYDDTSYVTLNPHVQAGLTPASIAWAFTTFDAGNWHPLTWLSLELDYQFHGLKPFGFHLTNVLLHAANAVLLLVLLARMTGARWRSAAVAAFFAWHPLRVESVAWISERKDVLSTFFGLIALLLYVSYVRSHATRREHPNRPVLFYLLALVSYALSLMSKGMLVTLPFLLLLLDYWPLRRIASPPFQLPPLARDPAMTEPPQLSPGILLQEKFPFFLLSAAGCVITFIAQREGGNVMAMAPLPLTLRLTTALYACFRYMERLFLPTHLGVYYPYQAVWPASIILVSVVLITGLSVNAFRRRASNPYLIVGWLWFLGTLVPVIGLVQIGVQALADRYTYIPSIGLLIMLVWDVEDLTRNWRHKSLLLAAAASLAACFCAALTREQERTWQNSETLFRQALRVAPDNHIARTGLGLALVEQGRTNEAAEQFEAATRIFPGYYYAQLGLGTCRLQEQQWAEAATNLQLAINAFNQSPDDYTKLGIALAHQGKSLEAAQAFGQALRLDPNWCGALYQLAWLRATDANPMIRDGAAALRLAQQAAASGGDEKARVPGVLDAAYAAAGQFAEAIAAAQKERDSAVAQKKSSEATAAEKRLELYRAGKAYTNENLLLPGQ